MKPLYLEVFAYTDFYNESKLNGHDDVCEKMPCINIVDDEKCWNPLINLKTGVIENWVLGNIAHIFYRVACSGIYFLQFDKGVPALRWNDSYVPGKYLSQTEDGLGDYIIMYIDENGKIKNWKEPEFNQKEWIKIDEKITSNN